MAYLLPTALLLVIVLELCRAAAFSCEEGSIDAAPASSMLQMRAWKQAPVVHTEQPREDAHSPHMEEAHNDEKAEQEAEIREDELTRGPAERDEAQKRPKKEETGTSNKPVSRHGEDITEKQSPRRDRHKSESNSDASSVDIPALGKDPEESDSKESDGLSASNQAVESVQQQIDEIDSAAVESVKQHISGQPSSEEASLEAVSSSAAKTPTAEGFQTVDSMQEVDVATPNAVRSSTSQQGTVEEDQKLRKEVSKDSPSVNDRSRLKQQSSSSESQREKASHLRQKSGNRVIETKRSSFPFTEDLMRAVASPSENVSKSDSLRQDEPKLQQVNTDSRDREAKANRQVPTKQANLDSLFESQMLITKEVNSSLSNPKDTYQLSQRVGGGYNRFGPEAEHAGAEEPTKQESLHMLDSAQEAANQLETSPTQTDVTEHGKADWKKRDESYSKQSMKVHQTPQQAELPQEPPEFHYPHGSMPEEEMPVPDFKAPGEK